MLQRTTIFLGAFILFLVQPLIGNTLLPMFGGTATVWNVCLATFQIMLVGGYFYAHIMGRRQLHWKYTLWLHCGMLLIASIWLFGAYLFRVSVPSMISSLPQALAVFAAIVLLVAAPYVILSANSTLVQVLAQGDFSLYAVSNLGSLAGLWMYPLAFERFFTLSQQWMAFAALALAYAVLFPILVFATNKAKANAGNRLTKDSHGVSDADVRPSRYFILSALSCFLLNAVSAHLGSDITPLPLLWVALLSLYLSSYILGFTERGIHIAPCAATILIPIALCAAWHMGLAEFKHFKAELVIASMILFLGGLVIHSRLYAICPGARHLTHYYLMIAIGGACGGSICSFAMPLISSTVVEYPIAVALVLAISLFVAWDKFGGKLKATLPPTYDTSKSYYWAAALVAIVGACGALRIGSVEGTVLKRYRNFYGSGSVSHRTILTSTGFSYEANEFRCNGTTHGLQATDKWKSSMPTVYYAAHAGGLPMEKHYKAKAGKPMRVGLCGMGIGTLAAYARHGDFYRFYEFNPAVADLANDRTLFTFLSDCRGTVDVVVDDARKALERERRTKGPKYDVLVVDVFNGDAIPPHMATREAFQLYLNRLEEDGILAFHLSNWHIDLMPMMKAVAQEFALELEAYYCASTQYAFESTWAFLSRKALPAMYDERCHDKVDFALVPDIGLMTDERHSLLPYIRWDLK